MSIIKDEDINKVSEKKYPFEVVYYAGSLQDAFTEGVKFAESKFEEIAIKWLNWYKSINYEKDYLGFTTNDLFQQFLKERDEL